MKACWEAVRSLTTRECFRMQDARCVESYCVLRIPMPRRDSARFPAKKRHFEQAGREMSTLSPPLAAYRRVFLENARRLALVVVGLWFLAGVVECMEVQPKSGRGLPHSRTLRAFKAATKSRQRFGVRAALRRFRLRPAGRVFPFGLPQLIVTRINSDKLN